MMWGVWLLVIRAENLRHICVLVAGTEYGATCKHCASYGDDKDWQNLRGRDGDGG